MLADWEAGWELTGPILAKWDTGWGLADWEGSSMAEKVIEDAAQADQCIRKRIWWGGMKFQTAESDFFQIQLPECSEHLEEVWLFF